MTLTRRRRLELLAGVSLLALDRAVDWRVCFRRSSIGHGKTQYMAAIARAKATALQDGPL